jgi:two-component system cell cycle response regulator
VSAVPSTPARFWARNGLPIVLTALAVVATAAYAVWLGLDRPRSVIDLFDIWVYHLAFAFSAAACFARAALGPQSRIAWLALGAGLSAWAAGDLYWTLHLADMKRIPYPSIADALYLAVIPCALIGIALLVRERVGRLTAGKWLDGLVGALGAAAVTTAMLGPALEGLNRGGAEKVFTNLAYPVGDVMLLALVVGAIAVGGLRRNGTLLLIALGLTVWTVTDALYLYLIATDSYKAGAIDLFWPVGAVLIGAASIPAGRRVGRRITSPHSAILVPIASALAAVTVLMLDHFNEVSTASVWLAGLTLAAVVARLLLTARENDQLVDTLRDEATTDALTGLGNRRKLLGDLERLLRGPRDPADHVFALFDLDGFKAYNDNFGHPAGDNLLERAGSRLAASMKSGTAYRLGGDEFCILERVGDRSAEEIIRAAKQALRQHGEGFRIGASCGAVRLPAEGRDASDALRAADQRMYADKGRSATRPERQTHDVLMRVLQERRPAVGEQVGGVGALAAAIGREIGLSAEELDVLRRAAELHDIGKIAIPDAILSKPGPLDEDEWRLIRTHTVIGERILVAAPALRPVAAMVRHSHERWDGGGYPDGLAGTEIPVGARIIFIADAYDAMTSDRSYRTAMPIAEALAELRANAGTQFDPRLTEIFCRTIEHGPRSADTTGAEPHGSAGDAEPDGRTGRPSTAARRGPGA